MQGQGSIERSPLYYYLAARLLGSSVINDRDRETTEINRRAKERKNMNLLDVTEQEFKKRYRLSKVAFKFLCEKLRQHTTLKPSQRISLELKVLCALSFYATGSYQRLVGMGKHLGQSTVSKYVREVTNALITSTMINTFIKLPETRAQRDAIKNQFYTKHGFPGVIGCIDGSHFHIFTPPKDREHLFYCRKHFYSLNVQVICDSECRILNINAKYGGATHDAFIWENSVANNFMQGLHTNNEKVWLLGDSGYPQRPWLMTPVLNAAEGSPEAKYNYVHGTARVSVENTFGRMKNRWRCLSKDRTLHYAPEQCAKIIMACSVLHNLAILFNIPEADAVLVDDEPSVISGNAPTFHENDVGDDLMLGRALRSVIVERIDRLHT